MYEAPLNETPLNVKVTLVPLSDAASASSPPRQSPDDALGVTENVNAPGSVMTDPSSRAAVKPPEVAFALTVSQYVVFADRDVIAPEEADVSRKPAEAVSAAFVKASRRYTVPKTFSLESQCAVTDDTC